MGRYTTENMQRLAFALVFIEHFSKLEEQILICRSINGDNYTNNLFPDWEQLLYCYKGMVYQLIQPVDTTLAALWDGLEYADVYKQMGNK